ncbi:hypothetical protein A0J61_08342 [Choanephora cucurbitarum]|uniref:Uncharacterized protein n=1 Tax=Choanephora cucurbitarum TaxID=101091 RepID=A0A1C7N3F7_9FUNG|nr:hypothetical protein A0J61_08342 [Choanephora cucurbitarum]
MKRSRPSRAEASSNWRSSNYSSNPASNPSREMGREHVARRQRTLDMWLNADQMNMNCPEHLSQGQSANMGIDSFNQNFLSVNNEQVNQNEASVFSFAPEINGHNALNNHISSAQTSWNPFNSRTISPFKSLVQQNTETADLMEVEPSIWPGNTQSNHSTTVQAFSSFSDSMQMSRNTMSIENEENCPIYRPYNVIKITNFPFHVGISDIKSIFNSNAYFSLPNEADLVQCVHVMMDIKTGKTMGTAFVEVICNDVDNIVRCLGSFNFRDNQAFRNCKFTPSSYDEICSQLFQNWSGQFRNGMAFPNAPTSNIRDMMMAGSKKKSFFISGQELQALVNICQKFKANFNRRSTKCLDTNPVESYLSTLQRGSW